MLRLTIKSLEAIAVGEFTRDPFYCRGLLPPLRAIGVPSKGFEKLPFSTPVAEPEHVKYGREDGREIEILD